MTPRLHLYHDPDVHKLGKLPVKEDPRTFRLAAYLDPALVPKAPDTVDWGKGTADWGMMLNDKYGDCTAAGVGHLFRLWNGRTNKATVIKDDDVLSLYEAVTEEEGGRFNPGTGQNDNGCIELDVLKYLRKNGFAGHSIDSFVAVDVKSQDYLKAAIWLFGAVYVGVDLPLSAQNQAVWQSTGNTSWRNKPGSWGGHCVIITAYDDEGLTCITWGTEKRLTWEWWNVYGTEAYALLSSDWIDQKSALSPSNFNVDQLKKDLAAL